MRLGARGSGWRALSSRCYAQQFRRELGHVAVDAWRLSLPFERLATAIGIMPFARSWAHANPGWSVVDISEMARPIFRRVGWDMGGAAPARWLASAEPSTSCCVARHLQKLQRERQQVRCAAACSDGRSHGGRSRCTTSSVLGYI